MGDGFEWELAKSEQEALFCVRIWWKVDISLEEAEYISFRRREVLAYSYWHPNWTLIL